MENLMFNVPSEISQSCMKYTDGDDGFGYELKNTEINYFYALLYIYRKKFLDQTDDALYKEDGKYKFDESVEYEPVEIALKEFSELWVDKKGKKKGVVTVGQYEDIRPFIKELKNLSIVVNLLRKNKNMPYTEIKMVDSLSWDETLKTETYLTIHFTKEFIKLFMLPENLFKPVYLKTLFLLRGKNQKLLYLLFKDFSKDEDNKKVYNGKKKLTIKDFEKLFGKVPQKLDEIIEKINSNTELTVHSGYPTGIGRTKTYKFTIENNEKTKKTAKKDTKQTKQKEEKNPEVWEKSVKATKDWIKNGNKVDSEDAYTVGIYNKEMAKTKPPEPSESEISIENWLSHWQFELEYDESSKQIPVLVIDVKEFYPIFIKDDYRLTGDPTKKPLTYTPEKTLEMLDEILENGGEPMIEYYDRCPEGLTKSCYLSMEELRRRRLI